VDIAKRVVTRAPDAPEDEQPQDELEEYHKVFIGEARARRPFLSPLRVPAIALPCTAAAVGLHGPIGGASCVERVVRGVRLRGTGPPL